MVTLYYCKELTFFHSSMAQTTYTISMIKINLLLEKLPLAPK